MKSEQKFFPTDRKRVQMFFGRATGEHETDELKTLLII